MDLNLLWRWIVSNWVIYEQIRVLKYQFFVWIKVQCFGKQLQQFFLILNNHLWGCRRKTGALCLLSNVVTPVRNILTRHLLSCVNWSGSASRISPSLFSVHSISVSKCVNGFWNSSKPQKFVLFQLKADDGIGIPSWTWAGGLAVSETGKGMYLWPSLPFPECPGVSSWALCTRGVWLLNPILHSDRSFL